MEAMKMNIDGTIRAKVLQYKQDGNTLTEKWETLTKHSEGIYYTLHTDKYGQKSLRIVFAKNGVYWYQTSAPAYLFDSESHNYAEHMAELRTMYANYEADILQAAASGRYINLLQISVMERLGYDPAPLVAGREAYLRNREEELRKRAEDAARREQQRKEAQERRKAELLAEGKKKLLAGERITVEEVELIAESVGYTIHGRTLGFMREKVSEVRLLADNRANVRGYKLTHRNISGTADVLREIAARIKAQAEKEAQQPDTDAETPQISTETVEAANVSAESAKAPETAKYRICRYAENDYAKITVGDRERGKVVAILLAIGGRSYIEINDEAAGIATTGQKPLQIAKPITALTDAEVLELIFAPSHPPKFAPQSRKTLPTVNYAATRRKRLQRANKRPN